MDWLNMTIDQKGYKKSWHDNKSETFKSELTKSELIYIEDNAELNQRQDIVATK